MNVSDSYRNRSIYRLLLSFLQRILFMNDKFRGKDITSLLSFLSTKISDFKFMGLLKGVEFFMMSNVTKVLGTKLALIFLVHKLIIFEIVRNNSN